MSTSVQKLVNNDARLSGMLSLGIYYVFKLLKLRVPCYWDGWDNEWHVDGVPG
jgi:hypothetical protein